MNRILIFIQPVILLSVLFGMPGCKKNKIHKAQTEPAIVNIIIKKIPLPDAPVFNFSEKTIKTRILKFLKNEGGYAVKLEKDVSQVDKPWELAMVWAVKPVNNVTPAAGKKKVYNRATEITVQIALRPLFEGARQENLQAESSEYITFSSLQGKELEKKMQTAFDKCLGQALAGVVLESRMMEADEEKLLEYLKNRELHIRKLAVNAVGQRQISSLAPRLRLMLKKESKLDFQMRIAGVLGQLQDKKAIKPLSDFAMKLDERHAVVVLEIISRIGGKDARVFLHWMESGHPDPKIKKAAGRYLKKMEERKSQ
ncbi:MAG: HEAT repeat domain-containing protein [Myxococcota bacterium]